MPRGPAGDLNQWRADVARTPLLPGMKAALTALPKNHFHYARFTSRYTRKIFGRLGVLDRNGKWLSGRTEESGKQIFQIDGIKLFHPALLPVSGNAANA